MKNFTELFGFIGSQDQDAFNTAKTTWLLRHRSGEKKGLKSKNEKNKEECETLNKKYNLCLDLDDFPLDVFDDAVPGWGNSSDGNSVSGQNYCWAIFSSNDC